MRQIFNKLILGLLSINLLIILTGVTGVVMDKDFRNHLSDSIKYVVSNDRNWVDQFLQQGQILLTDLGFSIIQDSHNIVNIALQIKDESSVPVTILTNTFVSNIGLLDQLLKNDFVDSKPILLTEKNKHIKEEKFEPRGPVSKEIIASETQNKTIAVADGKVLAANTTDGIANIADIRSIIASYLSDPVVQASFRGASGAQGLKGDKGEPGSVVPQNTTSGFSGVTPYYFPPQPAQNFNGASLFAATDLSSQTFTTNRATVNTSLTINGSSSLTGSLTLSGLGGGGTQCLQTDNVGVISGTGSACGAGGGGQTPWTSNIDAASYSLSNASSYNGLVVTANTGVITTGTWNATALTDTYVSDTLTVGSGSSVHWDALNNYPAACAVGSAISALADTTNTCTSFNTDTSITLQDAYNATGGNTITTTDARNIQITLADTATDQTFEITQAGTAIAFRVNDDGTFADSSPFIIDASGNVGIGTTSPSSPLNIVRSGSDASYVATSYSSTGWQGNYLVGNRAEGTSSSPSVVSTDDHIIGMTANAYANGGFNFTGSATFYVEGAPSGSNVPSYFVLWTSSTTGAGERLRVTSSGAIGLGTTGPGKQLEINSANGNNLRLTYNDSNGSAVNYADLLTTSGGDLTITPSGGDTTVTGNLALTGGNIYLDTNKYIGLNVFNGLSFISNQEFEWFGDGNTFIYGRNQATDGGLLELSGRPVDGTSSSASTLSIIPTFNPTSGTMQYTSTTISPTINQTGGANGISRGLYVNPTLTAVADYRAIELANNSSSSFGIYQSGANTKNYFAGNFGIGAIPSANKLTVEQSGAAQLLLQGASTISGGNSVDSGEIALGATAAYRGIISYDGVTTGFLFIRNTYNNDGGNIVFQTKNGASAADAMTIQGSGNVGIGANAPDKALEINSATGANLRLTYNDYNGSATNYADLLTTSGGDLTITPSGADVTITGNFASASADLGNGSAGYVVTLGRNTNGTNTGAGSINFQSKGGTAGYVWQDNAGNLRINTAAPSNANDTAGTVVGTQSSVRSTKQDITDYTDYASALQMVADAPLHTFRYIKDVQGYGSGSPLAKPRIGFIADEVSADFMWGNTIDQVSVNGILMASVKALNQKFENLKVVTTNTNAQTNIITGPLYLSSDSVGEAKILAGSTFVRINFTQSYKYQPVVTVTAVGESALSNDYKYAVTDKDVTGFTIKINSPLNVDVDFDWHAFAGADAQLTISNGSIMNIPLVLGASIENTQPDTNNSTETQQVNPVQTENPLESPVTEPSSSKVVE